MLREGGEVDVLQIPLHRREAVARVTVGDDVDHRAAGEQAGTYSVTFPAMPSGVYKMRANVSHDGETDTATFSGIEVNPPAPTAVGETSWFTQLVIGVVFMLVIILLFGLVYFVWRFAAGPGVNEEALSA